MFLSFFIFFFSAIIFVIALFFISFLISSRENTNIDKFDLYECGFKSFNNNSKYPSNIQFFLICILFVIFDIETIYLLPWALNFHILGYKSLLFVIIPFLFLLIVGYIYELKEKILD